MRIGVHVSIAGGLPEAVARAVARSCETMQVFAGNPRNWRDWEVSQAEAAEFKTKRQEADVFPLIVHAPYLINPASPRTETRNLSTLSTIQAVKAADLTNAAFFVVHTGSGGETSRRDALDRVAAFVHLVLENAQPRLKFLLENTAGTRGQVGSSFEDLARVIKLVGRPPALGVCLDTAHAFAAGYDLSNSSGLAEVLAQFDAKIGLERLGAIHCNDSKFPRGSNRDRHQHIGEGFIGLEGFRALVNHPRLAQLACILETPGDEVDDSRNVALMKSMRNGPYSR